MTTETITKVSTTDKQGKVNYMRDPYPRASFTVAYDQKKCSRNFGEHKRCKGTMSLMSVVGGGGVHERWFCSDCSACDAVNHKDYKSVLSIKSPRRTRKLIEVTQ